MSNMNHDKLSLRIKDLKRDGLLDNGKQNTKSKPTPKQLEYIGDLCREAGIEGIREAYTMAMGEEETAEEEITGRMANKLIPWLQERINALPPSPKPAPKNAAKASPRQKNYIYGLVLKSGFSSFEEASEVLLGSEYSLTDLPAVKASKMIGSLLNLRKKRAIENGTFVPSV